MGYCENEEEMEGRFWILEFRAWRKSLVFLKEDGEGFDWSLGLWREMRMEWWGCGVLGFERSLKGFGSIWEEEMRERERRRIWNARAE